MTRDPFAHLPHLRGRLTPADASALRPTDATIVEWDERARALGRAADWRIPHEVREASRRALLARRDPAADLWVYAYGSLMWDPGIHFAEVRLAEVDGHQRRFSFKSPLARGSADYPALMLALERQPGTCLGLAFRVAAASVDTESAVLWRREMIRGAYVPELVPARTPQGPIEALVFASNTAHADYVGEQPLAQTATVIATATGPLGSNRAYLEQLIAQLEVLGIEDAYVSALWQRVRGLAGPHPG